MLDFLAAHTILLATFSIAGSVGNCIAAVQAMRIDRRAIHKALLSIIDRVNLETLFQRSANNFVHAVKYNLIKEFSFYIILYYFI